MKLLINNIKDYTEPKKGEGYHLKSTLYTTNVKGVFKYEWYYPLQCNCEICRNGSGAGVCVAFDGYEVTYSTTKGSLKMKEFVTEKEAIDFYLKIKDMSGYKVRAPLYTPPDIDGSLPYTVQERITEYALKRGFNDYYDVKVVE